MTYSSFLLFVFLFLLQSVTVRSMDRPWSARHRGLSGARCPLFADPASIVVQPAGIAWMNSLTAVASFTPEIFELPELQTHSIAVGIPLSFGGIGFGVRRFGFDLYSETSVALGSGIAMENDLAVGASAEFRKYAIKGYGTQTLVLLNVGVFHKFHEMLTISGTVDNILNASLGKKNERLPRAVSLGLVAALSQEFLSVVEVEKNTRDPAFLKTALEFRPFSSIALRSGLSTNPLQWTAGCSVSLGPFSFGYGGTHHGILGWTHQVDVDFRGQL